jgi:hypothetical protein
MTKEHDELLKALQAVLAYAERRTCSHDETHRGGTLWEICDSCGAKWADDEGGKPEWVEPKELEEAHRLLNKYKTLGEQCEPKAKTLKRLRLSWKVGGAEGHGLTASLDLRQNLEAWCEFNNEKHGPGTHWIEEIEV